MRPMLESGRNLKISSELRKISTKTEIMHQIVIDMFRFSKVDGL